MKSGHHGAAVLHPFNPAEAIGIAEAARRACRAERTVREWCGLHQIGRKVAGRWAISSPALDMLLEGDMEALGAYLAGDRQIRGVRSYFERRGIPLPSLEAAASADFAAASEARK
jgi:hypothetical protein